MYCGTSIGPPQAATPAPPGTPPRAASPPAAPAPPAEPREIDSMDALTALIQAAYAAQGRGDLGEVGRMMSRLFREISASDRKQAMKIMTDSWLGGLKGQLEAAEFARAEELCQQGIAAATEDRFLDASRCFAQARLSVGANRRVNPALDWLALGAAQAGKLAVEDDKREAVIKDLINRGSTLLVAPGKTGEALDLFRQALALLPDPPIAERDRVRAERIRKLLEQYPKGAAPPPAAGAPATFLPPAGSLSHDAWNSLGERLAKTDAKQALICFERAVTGDPTVALYWLNKASALLATGAPLATVAEAYEKAAHRAPGEIAAWAGLAAALQQDGRYQEAIEAWNALLRLQPNAEAAKGQWTFCMRAATLEIEGANWDAPAWVAKAIALFEAKEWALADAAFERALRLAPRHIGALCGKGVVFYKWAVQTKASSEDAASMRFGLAAQYLREALQVDPGNEAARAVLDLCEKELGQGR